MPRKSRDRFRFLLVGIALSVALLVGTGWSNPTIATKVAFKLPEDKIVSNSWGNPLQDASVCGLAEPTSGNKSVKAIIPATNIGLTVTPRPSIFVYIPQTKAEKGFFSIQEEESNYYYQTSISLPKQSGVMEVSLPGEVPALEVGKNYKWSLAMICSQYLEPDSPFVTGWIRRVEANKNIPNISESKIALDRASKLAANGVWYDTLASVAKLRQLNPHNRNLEVSWQRLLESAQLNAIAQEPLVY
ncbi:DUF928 domain-containing protein [Calothrix sp. PCC 6303]|uniref:DUF928 domain-containing protein n=1 Tax=Calothrix sp. PCC 6303 TaxID=1170562 RepID=UPI0002A035E1|nr:DUF928 domain-containing protein [Calothrix sp. PCC 6303]AFZ00819.1 protein of unknown function DUF928 [Calothrix sp. PCC 6303]